MTIDEMIAVLQAAKAGRQIEWRYPTCEHWQKCIIPMWSFNDTLYRVKPEPRQWSAKVLPSGHLCTTFTGYAFCDGPLIKVREVL